MADDIETLRKYLLADSVDQILVIGPRRRAAEQRDELAPFTADCLRASDRKDSTYPATAGDRCTPGFRALRRS
jgi:hypothetical protein